MLYSLGDTGFGPSLDGLSSHLDSRWSSSLSYCLFGLFLCIFVLSPLSLYCPSTSHCLSFLSLSLPAVMMLAQQAGTLEHEAEGTTSTAGLRHPYLHLSGLSAWYHPSSWTGPISVNTDSTAARMKCQRCPAFDHPYSSFLSSVFNFLWGMNVLRPIPVPSRDQSWDFLPSVSQPCQRPLESSEGPASCLATA